jgi:hypothetical protein
MSAWIWGELQAEREARLWENDMWECLFADFEHFCAKEARAQAETEKQREAIQDSDWEVVSKGHQTWKARQDLKTKFNRGLREKKAKCESSCKACKKTGVPCGKQKMRNRERKSHQQPLERKIHQDPSTKEENTEVEAQDFVLQVKTSKGTWNDVPSEALLGCDLILTEGMRDRFRIGLAEPRDEERTWKYVHVAHSKEWMQEQSK